MWVANDLGFDARRITQHTGDDGMPIANLQLTPDAATVVYARGSQTNNAKGEAADSTSNVQQPEQPV